MDDLMRFLARDDLHPLHRASIGHARFEEIHPFPDGNGRTGRALVHALWGKYGLSSATTSVPYSAALALRKGAYFRALNSFHAMGSLSDDGGAVAPVVDVFAEAIQHALVRSIRLRDDLDAVVDRWRQVRLGRAGSLVSRVVDELPVVEADIPSSTSRDGALPIGGVPLCGEWMPKAKARCVLRAGHSGHHRATRPWSRTPDGR